MIYCWQLQHCRRSFNFTNPSIINYTFLPTQHSTAIPLPPSPALWKATRAHVRPCSCWALMCGAPVEQQWGRSPRHSTTNGHRAATSSPLPSLRDVGRRQGGDHNETTTSMSLPSSMTWVHDNEMRWPKNSQQEVDRRRGMSREVSRPLLPCFPPFHCSTKPSSRRCIATHRLVLHVRSCCSTAVDVANL